MPKTAVKNARMQGTKPIDFIFSVNDVTAVANSQLGCFDAMCASIQSHGFDPKAAKVRFEWTELENFMRLKNEARLNPIAPAPKPAKAVKAVEVPADEAGIVPDGHGTVNAELFADEVTEEILTAEPTIDLADMLTQPPSTTGKKHNKKGKHGNKAVSGMGSVDMSQLPDAYQR